MAIESGRRSGRNGNLWEAQRLRGQISRREDRGMEVGE
jgi:hypothetical protein